MKFLLTLPILAAPLFAGALVLEVGNPQADSEALAQHAVLVARMSACTSPEKTVVTASAEGIVDGERKSIPLKIARLSTAGTFAVRREWPAQGTWIVKMAATNPDYRDYAAVVLVPLDRGELQWASVKHYRHAPGEAEIAAVLEGESKK